MKLLIISDGHGNVEMLDKLDAEFKSCDAVLFGGDFGSELLWMLFVVVRT